MRIQLKLSRTRHILIIQASQQGVVSLDLITFDKNENRKVFLKDNFIDVIVSKILKDKQTDIICTYNSILHSNGKILFFI